MNIKWLTLVVKPYLFTPVPSGDFYWGYAFFVFFLLLLFLPTLIRRLTPDSKYLRKSMRKKFGKFIAMGVVGLLLVISRFSQVPYFSMRILLFILLFLAIIFGIFTFFKIQKEYRERLSSVEREKQRTGRR